MPACLGELVGNNYAKQTATDIAVLFAGDGCCFSDVECSSNIAHDCSLYRVGDPGIELSSQISRRRLWRVLLLVLLQSRITTSCISLMQCA